MFLIYRREVVGMMKEREMIVVQVIGRRSEETESDKYENEETTEDNRNKRQ